MVKYSFFKIKIYSIFLSAALLSDLNASYSYGPSAPSNQSYYAPQQVSPQPAATAPKSGNFFTNLFGKSKDASQKQMQNRQIATGVAAGAGGLIAGGILGAAIQNARNNNTPSVAITAPQVTAYPSAPMNVYPPQYNIQGSLTTPAMATQIPQYTMPSLPSVSFNPPQIGVQGSLNMPNIGLQAPQINLPTSTPNYATPNLGIQGGLTLPSFGAQATLTPPSISLNSSSGKLISNALGVLNSLFNPQINPYQTTGNYGLTVNAGLPQLNSLPGANMGTNLSPVNCPPCTLANSAPVANLPPAPTSASLNTNPVHYAAPQVCPNPAANNLNYSGIGMGSLASLDLLDPSDFPCERCMDCSFNQASQGKCQQYCKTTQKPNYSKEMQTVHKFNFETTPFSSYKKTRSEEKSNKSKFFSDAPSSNPNNSSFPPPSYNQNYQYSGKTSNYEGARNPYSLNPNTNPPPFNPDYYNPGPNINYESPLNANANPYPHSYNPYSQYPGTTNNYGTRSQYAGASNNKQTSWESLEPKKNPILSNPQYDPNIYGYGRQSEQKNPYPSYPSSSYSTPPYTHPFMPSGASPYSTYK